MYSLEMLEAILEMPAPVNYVVKFAPSVSEVTAPLRELLKEDVAWHWAECHEQSFHDIKCLFTETSPGLLKYYDPNMPVKLQVDACKSGLGAVLVQGGSPIAYGSLTETECNYSMHRSRKTASSNVWL